MKKILVLIVFALFAQSMSSQVFVENQNVNDLDIEYVQLIGINTSMFGVKIKIYVDYGQPAKFLKSESIKNTDGKAMKFNSMIDALNFMHKNGWSYVDYSEANFNGKIRYTYLLQRTK
jgi:hypothetical protein